ncbi:MAG TPA: hypothetical protein VIK18_14525, partial [Pirellulales bacterium]
GFQPHELELIANIARYHRGAEPKKKHANFSQLSVRDQQRVRQLSAILRLAGGLDRSNSQQVRDLAITADGNTLVMHVIADQLPEVDIWTAKRRSDAFERAFGMPLEIRWENPAEAENRSASA